MGLDDLHLFQRQSQHPVLADLHQLGIADLEIDLLHGDPVTADVDLRHMHRQPFDGVELCGRHDDPALDQAVGQEAGGNPFGYGLVDLPLEQVLNRGVDCLTGGKAATGQILDRLLGRAADVVGHAGAVADLDEHVEVPGQRPVDRHFLNHRVAKRAGSRRLHLGLGELRIDGVDIDGAHTFEVDAEMLANLAAYALAARVTHPVFQSCQYSPSHMIWSFVKQSKISSPRHQDTKIDVFLGFLGALGALVIAYELSPNTRLKMVSTCFK